MIYIFGILLNYLTLLSLPYFRQTRRCAAVGLLILVGVIPIFRGSVGVDTPMYESFANEVLRYGYISTNIEPGLTYIFKFLGYFSNNEIILVRGVAALFVLLLIIYASHSKRDELFFLTAFFIPAIFYEDSLNAVRFGLASALFLLVVQNFYSKSRTKLFLITVASMACLTHYSIILAFCFIFFCINFKSKSWLLLLFLGMALAGLLLSTLEPEYTQGKVDLYLDYSSPAWYSGISSVVVILICLLGTLKSIVKFRVFPEDGYTKHHTRSTTSTSTGNLLATLSRIRKTALLLVSISIFISQYSYAGLRFLQLAIRM
ncbi:hypothetical protein CDEF62S_00160 [Castellaniella defragrans]